MAVLIPDYDFNRRGLADAARHREKIKEAIKRNLPDIISDEAIITRSGDQIVRVPVRGIKSYRFIYRYRMGRRAALEAGNRKKAKSSGSAQTWEWTARQTGRRAGRRLPGNRNRTRRVGGNDAGGYRSSESEQKEIRETVVEGAGSMIP